ncbi:DUF4199 family protein [Parasediminibacterium sp. JCM 36343]|uniref:DUF4199 family protein n=1 Tax=Parasediminibacterium sp. JCM 36343 TaxID=3374279 RepID=UPI00397E1DCD
MDKQKTHIKKGVVIAAILVLLDIVLQLTHQKLQPWVMYANSGILATGVLTSIFISNNSNPEDVTFSFQFGYGFKVAVVVVCILFIYTLLSTYIVFPGYINDLYQQRMLEAKQQMTKLNVEEAKAQQAMAIKVIGLMVMSGMVMLNLAVGIAAAFVGSVIGLLMKKKANSHQIGT